MEFNRNEVSTRVIALVSETLAIHADQLTEQTSLGGDLNASSMDVVALAIALDDEFRIEIDLSELPAGDATVKDVVDYVCSRIANSL